MAILSLTPSQALRRSRRLDLRAVVAFLLLVAGVLGSMVHWSSVSGSRGVLALTHDLPAGALVQRADLRTVQVRLDDSLYAAAVPATDQETVVGKPLTEAVHGRSLLLRAQLSSRPPLPAGHVALTVPVTPDNASGGRIHPGDLVQVLSTVGKGKTDPHTDIVLDQIPVWDVSYESRGSVVSTTGTTPAISTLPPLHSVTLDVTPEQARRVALARWTGDIDVALHAVGP